MGVCHRQNGSNGLQMPQTPNRPTLKPGLNAADKQGTAATHRLRSDVAMTRSCSGACGLSIWMDPQADAWQRINEHLGTTAASLPEFVKELGELRFGHTLRVGDAFCGGGSVPFEAARLGCEAHGSDLNPVAALLTWGALNIVGGGEKRCREHPAGAGRRVCRRQSADHGIGALSTTTSVGALTPFFIAPRQPALSAAGAYLWRRVGVIGEKTRTIAQLRPEPEGNGASPSTSVPASAPMTWKRPRNAGTAKHSRLVCPNPRHEGDVSTPMTAIRGDQRGGSSSAKTDAGREIRTAAVAERRHRPSAGRHVSGKALLRSPGGCRV